MSQIYDIEKPESGATLISELYGIIKNHIAALATCFAGTSYPTGNAGPFPGQLCYRTDLGTNGKLMKYNSIGAWEEASVDSTVSDEVILARGDAVSLDARLDVAINEDGTLRGDAPSSNWWTEEGQAETYIDSTSFSLPIDLTAIYTEGRPVYFSGVAGAPQYSRIISSTWGSVTTIVIEDAILDSSLSAVFYGQSRYNVGVYRDATDALKGIVEKLTQAEFLAMTDTTRYVTADQIADIAQYSEIYIDAASMTPGTTNGANIDIKEYTAGNNYDTDHLVFIKATEKYIYFNYVMPPTWDRATLRAKFYWSSDTGSSETDTVEWEISAIAVGNDDSVDEVTFGTSQVISDALENVDGTDMQISDTTPAIVVGGTPELGDMIIFKVSRNIGGTDDMSEDAWLFGILLQIKNNKAVSVWS